MHKIRQAIEPFLRRFAQSGLTLFKRGNVPTESQATTISSSTEEDYSGTPTNSPPCGPVDELCAEDLSSALGEVDGLTPFPEEILTQYVNDAALRLQEQSWSTAAEIQIRAYEAQVQIYQAQVQIQVAAIQAMKDSLMSGVRMYETKLPMWRLWGKDDSGLWHVWNAHPRWCSRAPSISMEMPGLSDPVCPDCKAYLCSQVVEGT